MAPASSLKSPVLVLQGEAFPANRCGLQGTPFEYVGSVFWEEVAFFHIILSYGIIFRKNLQQATSGCWISNQLWVTGPCPTSCPSQEPCWFFLPWRTGGWAGLLPLLSASRQDGSPVASCICLPLGTWLCHLVTDICLCSESPMWPSESRSSKFRKGTAPARLRPAMDHDTWLNADTREWDRRAWHPQYGKSSSTSTCVLSPNLPYLPRFQISAMKKKIK